MLWFFLWLVGVFVVQAPAFSQLDYENCKSCPAAALTAKITNQFPSAKKEPKDCGCRSGPLEVIKSVIQITEVPDECFLASKVSQPRQIGRSEGNNSEDNNYRQCRPETRQKTFYQEDPVPTPRCDNSKAKTSRYCFNKEYVKMTSKAFHDVMNCVGLNPKKMFALYNHESRFILNNVSETGAVCYGQLTGPTIHAVNDLNQMKYSFYKRKENSLKQEEVEGLRIENLLKKCPTVKKHFKKLDTVELKKSFNMTYPAHCDVAENPYSCFLYSAIKHKRDMKYARSIMKNRPVYVTKKKDPPLIFRNKRRWEKFRNRYQQKDNPQKGYLNGGAHNKIFKNEDQIVEIVSLASYNGGVAVAKILFREYLERLRERLADKNNKKLREKVINGGIETESFAKGFKKYIKNNYRWGEDQEQRQKEVSQFVGKIKKDLADRAKQVKNGKFRCADPTSYLYPGNE